MVSSISTSDLKEKMEKINLIDIRSIEKYNDNHIPGAQNAPFEKLILEPKKFLNFTDTYYIYCQKGTKSVSMCVYLQKQGFKVINIRGGYENWIMEN